MAKFGYEQITIIGANNGFIVQVGCKTLVFKDTEANDVMHDLGCFISGASTEEALRRKYCPEDYKGMEEGTGQGQCERAYPVDVPPPCEPQTLGNRLNGLRGR